MSIWERLFRKSRIVESPYVKNGNVWIDKETRKFVKRGLAEMYERHDIRIKPVREHYEAFIDGKFICSGDTYSECEKDVNEYIKNLFVK